MPSSYPSASSCRRGNADGTSGPPCVRFAGGQRRHTMAKPEFDLAVIGGGAGGLVVAAGGAALGAKVALVEKHKLGGDCLWYGCVPSKTLIKSARIAHQMRHADRWALTPARTAARSRPRDGAGRRRDQGHRAERQPRALPRPRRRRHLRRRPLRRPRRVRGRRPPPHGEELRHRHRLAARGAADPRPRRDALPHQRDGVRAARGRART